MGIRDISKYIKDKTNATFVIPYDLLENQHIVYDASEMLFRYGSAIFGNMTYDDIPEEATYFGNWDLVDYLIMLNEDEIIRGMAAGLRRYPKSTHITFIMDGEDRENLTDGFDALGGIFDIWEQPVDTGLETDVYNTLEDDLTSVDGVSVHDYAINTTVDDTNQTINPVSTPTTPGSVTQLDIQSLKADTITRRIKRTQSATKRIRSKGSISLSRLFRITSYAKRLIHYLIDYVSDMQLDVIYANGEADFVCALYCNEGKAFACVTRDSDQLAYGSELQILKAGTNGLYVRYIDVLLQELDITKEQLREWCILLGTDYNLRIRGMGPVNSLKVVKGLKEAPSKEDLDLISRFDQVWEIFSSAEGFVYLNGAEYYIPRSYIRKVLEPYIPFDR